jgi:ELWxxDGT repeat protein
LTGISGSGPNSLITWKNKVYCAASQPSYGTEIWISDGTAGGTYMLKDLTPGSGSSSYYYPSFEFYPSLSNKYLYFTGISSSAKLWKTDGTEQGTTLVKDFVTGNLGGLANVNGITIYSLNSSIFKTDTTFQNSIELKGTNGYQQPIFSNGSRAYFQVFVGSKYELWVTDGTIAGTIKIKQFQEFYQTPEQVTFLNEELFFWANDGISGLELWKSDGTVAGTKLIRDIVPGNNTRGATSPIDQGLSFYLASQNNKVYFTYDDGVHGRELWITDGTEPGTHLLKDIFDGEGSSFPEVFTPLNGGLYFTAYDGINRSIWKTNGKECGTFKVTQNTNVEASFARSMGVVGDKIYLKADDFIHGAELFVHDTKLDIPFPDGCRSSQAIVFEAISNKVVGDAPFSLEAQSNSGLEVQFTSTSNRITINDGVVTILQPGPVTITANQPGDMNFESAPEQSLNFCINPVKPTIVSSENAPGGVLLTSNSLSGNQWLLNGQPISGEIEKTLLATEDGVYSVQVEVESCKSMPSENVEIVITGIENGSSFRVYPNPVNKKLCVETSNPAHIIERIKVRDVMGRIIMTESSPGSKTFIDFESQGDGFYFVEIYSDNKTKIVRLIKK